jgi:hypothetical protein
LPDAPGAPPVHAKAPRYTPTTSEHDVQVLRAQAEHLEGTLEDIRKRIAELEAARKDES